MDSLEYVSEKTKQELLHKARKSHFKDIPKMNDKVKKLQQKNEDIKLEKINEKAKQEEIEKNNAKQLTVRSSGYGEGSDTSSVQLSQNSSKKKSIKRTQFVDEELPRKWAHLRGFSFALLRDIINTSTEKGGGNIFNLNFSREKNVFENIFYK